MYSVTKLIDLLNKPFLLKWANGLGLKGLSLDSYMKDKSSSGNNKHKQIEQYFINGIDFDNSHKIEYIKNEYEIIGCEVDINNGYINGRVDLILKKNDKTYIVDFKSNKNIYLSTKLQLSTYKHIYNADHICYINFDNYNLEIINIDTNKYYEIVKRLYQIKTLITELNEYI